jgi:hypothetical protein
MLKFDLIHMASIDNFAFCIGVVITNGYKIAFPYKIQGGSSMLPSETRANSAQPRDININIRAKRTQRDLIDQAAEMLGKSRSDFMLETACREAEE